MDSQSRTTWNNEDFHALLPFIPKEILDRQIQPPIDFEEQSGVTNISGRYQWPKGMDGNSVGVMYAHFIQGEKQLKMLEYLDNQEDRRTFMCKQSGGLLVPFEGLPVGHDGHDGKKFRAQLPGTMVELALDTYGNRIETLTPFARLFEKYSKANLGENSTEQDGLHPTLEQIVREGRDGTLLPNFRAYLRDGKEAFSKYCMENLKRLNPEMMKDIPSKEEYNDDIVSGAASGFNLDDIAFYVSTQNKETRYDDEMESLLRENEIIILRWNFSDKTALRMKEHLVKRLESRELSLAEALKEPYSEYWRDFCNEDKVSKQDQKKALEEVIDVRESPDFKWLKELYDASAPLVHAANNRLGREGIKGHELSSHSGEKAKTDERTPSPPKDPAALLRQARAGKAPEDRRSRSRTPSPSGQDRRQNVRFVQCGRVTIHGRLPFAIQEQAAFQHRRQRNIQGERQGRKSALSRQKKRTRRMFRKFFIISLLRSTFTKGQRQSNAS